jgi:pyruvate dehydrogenase E1 component alpha subunit
MQQEVKRGGLKAATYPVAGLEGACAALGLALTSTDYLVSTYRNLGDAIAKGVPLPAVVAEVAGRATGVAKGKGGAMHIADRSVGLMTTTGIVGSGLPIATGLALSSHLSGDGRVTAVTFGDGATSIGAFHEAMNLAALWRLPVLFVCQNNQWGEHTPIHEYTAVTELAEKVRAYGVGTRRTDGFDSIATLEAIRAAVEEIRSGDGPQFVEVVTYRLGGHTSTTDYSYMPAERLRAARTAEPVGRLRAQVLATAADAHDRLAALDAEAQSTVDGAFAFAYGSAYPDPDEMYTDVFSTSPTEVFRS